MGHFERPHPEVNWSLALKTGSRNKYSAGDRKVYGYRDLVAEVL